MTREKKRGGISRTDKTLLALIETAGYIYETGMKTYRGPFSMPKEYYSRDRKEYNARQSLLRHKKIRTVQEGQEVYFQLTDKGYLSALKALIVNKKRRLPEGEFCLVIFDVPEDMRNVRTAFRALLKRAEFYKVQRSVWESEHEVVEEVRALVDELKLQKYIRVYRANGER